jgi:hypothetical protein
MLSVVLVFPTKGPPKWITKTVESVHPDELGKTRTKLSPR